MYLQVFFSRNNCIKLAIISHDISRIIATVESCNTHKELQTCYSIPRTPPFDSVLGKTPVGVSST